MASGFQLHLPCSLFRSLRTLLISYHTSLIKLWTRGGELAVYRAMSPCRQTPQSTGSMARTTRGRHTSVLIFLADLSQSLGKVS